MRHFWFSLCCLFILGLLALLTYQPLLVSPPSPDKAPDNMINKAPTHLQEPSTQTLKICSDLWMPYAGEAGSEYEGYFIDIMRQIYEPVGYRIDYSVMPWSNCMEQVGDGMVDGLVATVFSQTPDLVFPESSLGLDQTDFFTKADSTWRFTKQADLNHIKLGAVQDYDYQEWLDIYIHRNSSTGKIWFARGEDPMEKMVAALQEGQIDAFVENPEVVNVYLKKHRGRVRLRNAGTVGTPNRLFAAFSPRKPKSEELAQLLDRKIDDLRLSGQLQAILSRYGMRDWRQSQSLTVPPGTQP